MYAFEKEFPPSAAMPRYNENAKESNARPIVIFASGLVKLRCADEFCAYALRFSGSFCCSTDASLAAWYRVESTNAAHEAAGSTAEVALIAVCPAKSVARQITAPVAYDATSKASVSPSFM